MKTFIKNSYKKFVVIAFLLFLLGVGLLLLIFIFNLLKNFIGLLQSSNPTIAVAIITGAFTLMVSMGAKSMEKRFEIDREHRKRKIAIYQKFLPKWLDIIAGKKVKRMESEEERFNFLREGIGDLVSYSSGHVLKALIEFRRQAALSSVTDNLDETDRAKQNLKLFLSYEKVILAIRKDLGHRDWFSLQNGDLMRTFINDYEEVRRKAQRKKIS